MKRLVLVLAIAVLYMGTANAESLEEKLQACNAKADSKSLKDPEHRDFVRECVTHTRDVPSLEDKTKMCNANADTKMLKDDERTAFIKECMSI
jgi:hypothetical protein